MSSRGERASSQDPSFGGKITSWVTLVLPPLPSASKKASNPSISASSFQTLKSVFKTEIRDPGRRHQFPANNNNDRKQSFMVQMMKNIIRGNKQVPGANVELLLARAETHFMKKKKRSCGSSLPIFCLEEEDEKKSC